MCTLYTFNNDLWTNDRIQLENRIRQDWRHNSDGASILGGNDIDPCNTFLQTFSLETTIAMINSMFSDGSERVWIHLRSATTTFVNLNGIHGFIADSYRVFHNGVLSRADSYKYNVDSELIAEDIKTYGLQTALNNLSEDSFANVMIVDVNNGNYHINRTTSGSLHTDGNGNYSTYAVGSISVSVVSNYRKDYINEYNDPIAYDSEIISESDFEEYDTFVRFAEEGNWWTNGIPESVYTQLTEKQLQWAWDLNISVDWSNRYCENL